MEKGLNVQKTGLFTGLNYLQVFHFFAKLVLASTSLDFDFKLRTRVPKAKFSSETLAETLGAGFIRT